MYPLRRLRRRLTSLPPARDASAAGRYLDPVDYATHVLGVTLTPVQSTIARLLLRPPYRVLVPSANSQGKTFLAACLASWWYDTFDPSITLTTATTAVQVRDLLFRELRTLRRRNLAGFSPKATRLQSTPAHFVHGFTTKHPDAFQGRHDTRLLLIFDEATGIHRDFWKRGDTMFGGVEGHGWLCFYNPNDPSSYAYEMEESGLWHVARLSALDHPNVAAELRGEAPPVPSAIRLPSVVNRLLSECRVVDDGSDPTAFQFPPQATASWPGAPKLTPGQWWLPETPDFEAQVLGRWPVQGAVSLLTPALVQQAAARSTPIDPDWPVVIGADVARFGDDRSAFAVRQGPCLVHLEAHSRRDTLFLTDRLEQLAHEFTGGDTSKARRVAIYIDDTGGYGAGAVDQLASRGYYGATGLHFSSASPDPRVLRLRSYLWFRLAELATAGVVDFSRLDSGTLATLRADLTAPRYQVDAQGRKVLEPKSQVKSRLGRSPDLGDAVALAYYA